MHAWESIQKVLDYIEDNLAQSNSPEELSKVAALSPFYFQRLFTRLVKRPVSLAVGEAKETQPETGRTFVLNAKMIGAMIKWDCGKSALRKV